MTAHSIIYLGISKNALKKDIDNALKGFIPSRKKRIRSDKYGQYLKVWDERKLKKPFQEISKFLKVNEDSAKKMFYNAYEIIYRKKYTQNRWKELKIEKKDFKKTCENCSDINCTIPCPEILPYIDQDNKNYQRELLLS